MDDHTLRVLEFEKVLALLAGEAAFSVGRELCLGVRPLTEFDAVAVLQWQTAEMRLLDEMGIDVPFSGAKDIRPAVHAAGIGQLLEPPDLVDSAQTLRTAFRARQVLERLRDRVPRLTRIGESISDFRNFSDEVDKAITPRGEVADSASDTLAHTRRELRVAQDRLEQRASAALADAIRRGIAQEGLLTERNGRKVIMLKSDYRGQMAGIVHDVSASGATIFLEPMAVVEAGNQVRELQLAEQREVRRVLQRLTTILGDRAEDAERSVMTLAKLDMLNAKARLARKLKAQLPPSGDGDSWLRHEGATIIESGRHPLLRGDVVPTDIAVGGGYAAVLITGPNTGGKTVALKTMGLLTLMVQAGLPVPCEESSRFVVYPRLYADIGDEQSIEQSLSTFSSHMRNIKDILAKAAPGTLVLLDELGAGTDPAEGSALARAVLETLLERGCTIVATTHHGELKAFAHNDPRLRNASVEFNIETLSPTYKLTIGLPGQSNAIAIARRLGLDPVVLERASAQLSPQHFELEQLLEEIRSERAGAAEARTREEIARRESEDLRRQLAERRDRIEQERLSILGDAKRDAEGMLISMRREMDQERRRIATRSFDTKSADETLKKMDAALAKVVAQSRPQRRELEVAAAPRDLEPGDRVHVRDIPQEGIALSGIDEGGRVDLQFGSIRMKVSVDRIDRVEAPERDMQVALPVPERSKDRPNVPLELDLRGQRADEALNRFETYIDQAFQAGMPFVRIIHGKGTGALRAAIREAMTGHPLVRKFETPAANEGGEGVTVAILAG